MERSEVDLAQENQRLKRAVAELSILNEVASAISSTLSLNRIVETIVGKCVKYLKVEQGSVVLLNAEGADSPFRTMVRTMDSQMEMAPYRFDDQLTGWMLNNRAPLLIDDLQSDSRFSIGDVDDFPIRSLLSVPLVLKGQLIGLLNAFNKRDASGFSEEDQRLLSIIAAQSAQVIENARLHEEEQALLRMREELRVAHDIQVNLLPKAAPDVTGYDIAGLSIPAQNVGGDYYDFISIDDHRLAVCLGDVTGKGMPAALLMANVQATIRGQVLQDASPCACMKQSNTLMFHSTDPQRFVTFFYGVMDTESHDFRYCNAGHNYPFLFSEGDDPQTLETGGVILGIFDGMPYEETSVPFQPGDTLVIYSDGITEAMDEREEDFGEERLVELVNAHRALSAEALIGEIVRAVRHHRGDAEQMDDMTVVVIKRASL